MTQTPELTLTLTLRSPFARRVRLALLRLGLPFQEKVMDVFQPPPELFLANPLGLVPVLSEAGGEHLVDSAAILETLHETHGGIWPASEPERRRQRQASTLAEGIMAAAVAYFLESRRPQPDPEWIEEHEQAATRALQALSKLPAEIWCSQERITQAGWDLGVALEYLDLRMPQLRWRERAPALEPWLERCRGWEPFRRTTP